MESYEPVVGAILRRLFAAAIVLGVLSACSYLFGPRDETAASAHTAVYLNASLIPSGVEIVVARYNEDLSWLPNDDCIVVYDKGEEPPKMQRPRTRWQYSRLDNVGREAHSFLHHIVERYDDLAAVTVFTQGFPFDHAPNWTGQLRGLVETALSTGSAGCTIGVAPISEWMLIRKYRVTPSRSDTQALWSVAGKTGIAPPPWLPLPFWLAAQFAVRDDVIRRIPRARWEALRDALAVNGSNPAEAHYMERLWCHLLCGGNQ